MLVVLIIKFHVGLYASWKSVQNSEVVEPNYKLMITAHEV